MLLLASPPPQTRGNEGSSPPPRNFNTQIGPRAPQASGMQQLHGKPHGGSDGEAPHCFPRHLPEGKAPITLAPASVCRRVIQHMCFQRAGGEGDLPLTYFLLLLEVLISMQNSASRQKLSLGSGFTSALHGSLHHRSHQFQPGCSRFTPLPVPGRSDLVLPSSTENCRLSRSRFWPGKGFTCSLG